MLALTASCGQLKGTATPITSDDFRQENDRERARLLSLAVPAGAVVPMVRTAAEAVDRAAAGLRPERSGAIEQAGRGRILSRFIHRRAHLDQIEETLRDS